MRPANKALPRTVALLEEGRRTGLHAGAQVYVSVQGETAADFALGEARPGCPMETDTLTPWLSSGKPITAVALAQLAERGRLSFDDPVSRFISEFGSRGKESITLKHLLTHTAGFRTADKLPDSLSWEETIARICDTPLEPEWKPGEKAGYQISSSWFVLGEVLQRLDGRSFERYVREEIFEPLGLKDSWIGLPVETFREYGDRIGFMYLSERGELKPHPVLNSPEAVTASRPASNARGPIQELAKFYEELLLAWAGPERTPRILSPETIRTLASRHRVGLFDHTFGHTLDWGLGFLLDSNRYGPDTVPYGYGPHASIETFGHSGSQSSCAFADPQQGLVVAWICNGQPGEPRHQKRARAINAAIYEDVTRKT
jgi:CubicO group peptidase (beta-lactamase class C family)